VRSLSRDEVQRAVRQRDRFSCQNPECDSRGEQYAHIVAEADGGAYDLSNLLYLCYTCHKDWQETESAKPLKKARLLEISYAMRDQDKRDSLISSVLSWPAGESLAVALGGGIRTFNCPNVLESSDPNDPYLSISVNTVGHLRVDARFEDSNGRDFMKINGNDMVVNTGAVWDIAIRRGSFSIENAERAIKLAIRQDDDLTLRITGRLFLNGGFFQIDNSRILDETKGNTYKNVIAAGFGRGFKLSTGVSSFNFERMRGRLRDEP